MKLTLILLTCCVSVFAASTVWQVSPLGDARKAVVRYDVPQKDLSAGAFTFEIPKGEWNDITATYWIRNRSTNSLTIPQNYYQTIQLNYCPEPIQRALPDELAEAGGWGVAGGVDVVGSLVIPYTFAPHWSYTNRVVDVPRDGNQYGAYTINAVVDAPMGLSLGGVEHTLAAGTNVFNSYGGPSSYVTITGNGKVQIGMSKLYWHQYFHRINGVADTENNLLTKDSIVTNEIVFVTCRIHLDATSHWTHDSLIHYDGNDVQGHVVTNSMPLNPACRALSSKGDYKTGVMGLGSDPEFQVDIFDFRVHTWLLTDEEIQRTFRNGKEEILRRGIPKNKGY